MKNILFLAGIAMLAMVGCMKDVVVGKTEPATRTAEDNRPFYYYFGEKIYLTMQPN